MVKKGREEKSNRDGRKERIKEEERRIKGTKMEGREGEKKKKD